MTAHDLHADWAPGPRALLTELIDARGASAPGYDPAAPPYAVFDCDNTTVFRDVQDVVLTEQLTRLDFGLPARALGEVLREGLHARPTLDLLDDVVESLGALEAGVSDPRAREDHHLAARVKLRALYHTLNDHHGDGFACSWVTRLYAGMTPARVHELARAAYAAELDRPVSHATETSPGSLPGRAGVVDVTWPQGLRPVVPVRELFATLTRAGFEVWICSASFEHIVRAAVAGGPLGYPVRASHVMGMRLDLDEDGAFTPRKPEGAIDTHGEGKVANVAGMLEARLGYPPALVAGDSNGDAPMLAHYHDALRLIFNRHLDGPIAELAARAATPGARVALQGRDERRGVLLPTGASVLTAP
jgi:phosphoserine phosphatase